MSVPIVLQIPEEQDFQNVREEWEWLVQPLADAISLPVSLNPENLYVDPKDFENAYRLNISPHQRAIQFKGGWEERFRLLTQHCGVPQCLLGSVGVGKTSLLSRLAAYLKTRPDTSVAYYDHHVKRGRIGGQNLDEVERMRCCLHSDVLRTIHNACRSRNEASNQVFQFDPDEVADRPEASSTKMEHSMRNACETLYHKSGHWLFLIIDNLDEYSCEEQYQGVSTAHHFSTWPGVICLVALRPETLYATQAHLINAKCIEINPASLDTILRQRLTYLWSDEGRPHIEHVLAKFRQNDLSLRVLWAPEIIDHNPDTLKSLHVKIVQAITENRVLEDAVKHLHNYNMRETLEVVSRLLLSGFFSERLIQEMEAKQSDIPSRRLGKQYIITTYLRGPYLRYRGRTQHYRVRQLNIIDIPGVPPNHILIAIRALQLLSKNILASRAGIVILKLIEVCYTEPEAKAAIEFLARAEFVKDVLYQKPWASSPMVQLTLDDEFTLAPAGEFLLNRFLNDFAFRYCEAMADVTSRSRLDGQPWAKGRTPDALAFNACGILELFASAGEHELKSILNGAGKAKAARTAALQRFQGDFGSPEVFGREFLISMAEDCDTRSGVFVKDYELALNFESMTKLKNIQGTIGKVREKCLNIQEGTAYL
jgi:GTPase SAR1 family protein